MGVVVGLSAATFLPAELPLWQLVLLTGALGIVSHYVMDVVPHGHYDFESRHPSQAERARLAVDLLVPIFLIAILLLIKFGMGPASWLVGAAVAGAQLPDVFDGLLASGRIPRWRWAIAEKRFHVRTHWHNPVNAARATAQGGRRLGPSDMWQVLVGLVALVWLLTY
jgi:hypothetical protein